jgi:hypothetical protein
MVWSSQPFLILLKKYEFGFVEIQLLYKECEKCFGIYIESVYFKTQNVFKDHSTLLDYVLDAGVQSACTYIQFCVVLPFTSIIPTCCVCCEATKPVEEGINEESMPRFLLRIVHKSLV